MLKNVSSNPVIPTMRAPSSVVRTLGRHPRGGKFDSYGAHQSWSLSEMDITEVYETSSPSSTLGETANYFLFLLFCFLFCLLWCWSSMVLSTRAIIITMVINPPINIKSGFISLDPGNICTVLEHRLILW
jgi:hypothetical protein